MYRALLSIPPVEASLLKRPIFDKARHTSSAVRKTAEFFYDVCDSFCTGIPGAKCGFLTQNATRCKPSQNSLGVLYFQCQTVIFGTILTRKW